MEANRVTKVGGCGKIMEVDDECRDVLRQVRAGCEEKAGKKFEIFEPVHFRTQLVNGINFFVKGHTLIADPYSSPLRDHGLTQCSARKFGYVTCFVTIVIMSLSKGVLPNQQNPFIVQGTNIYLDDVPWFKETCLIL
ncbi:cystatin-A2-like [Tropilaelaps mercedesae]|uniref:Cystatin-A2-like n=1 Tax=Tropilaelaps mercedesae TaxID=418985 RepID=A0A1V9XEH9_9ACAR|nr:cystatin-A2-like [Tropilaelaps mercedesae]